MLGHLEVLDGERSITVSAPKQRSLLLLLLANASTVVSTDVILDNLWPDEMPATGVKTVRFHISKLRKALGAETSPVDAPVIETHGSGYLIDSDRHTIDARTFESLVDAGYAELEGRPDRAQRLLREALDLWRGPAFSDVTYEGFAANEARRLEELRLAAMESRIAAELRLGRSIDLVGELESLVASHPERERPTELLMQALYAAGRSADAIAAARDLRDRLAEMGLEPQPSLTALEERILRHEGPVAAVGRDLDVATRAPAAALPTPLTSFIGRSVEIQDVRTLVRNGRLVTLVGSPGSGKTRLALEVTRQLEPGYTDGAVMVELSEVVDPSLVAQAVSTALGISAPVGADYAELIVSALRARESLVLLDNCEHVVGNAARLVLSILQACSRVKVLATSREALGVPGERVWPVPPFALPPGSDRPTEALLKADSIRLFIDRAQEVKPDFDAEPCLKEVEIVCRRLDGLPLAIELAASTIEALTPLQIADRLASRFVEVPSGRRPGLAHQATMEDAVRWSYDLLSATDQQVFNRLSVFAGGFSMDAAEAVAGWGDVERTEVFDSVLRLAHQSLLIPLAEVQGGVRYRMLTVIRQFGSRVLRSLDETAEVDRRHAAYFAALAEDISPHLQGPQEAQTRAVADLELDNFRHALESSLAAGRPETAMQITAALTWYWYWRSYVSEGLSWARRALAAAPGESTPERAQVLHTVALFENIAGNFAAGSACFAEANEIARDQGLSSLEAATLTGLGVSLRDMGRLSEALDRFDQAVTIDRQIGDRARLALALRFAASVNLMLGRAARAVEQADESYAIFEDLGHRGGMGWALETQGRIALRLEQGGGFELLQRAREHFAEVQDRRNDAWVLMRMAESHLQVGARGDARDETSPSLGIFEELNDRRGIAYAIMQSGLVGLVSKRFDEAGADLRRALRLFLDIGDEGGASAASGFLACLAARDGDLAGAVEHLERWLSLPARDRYVWSYLGVVRQLALTTKEPSGAAETLVELAQRLEADLRSGADPAPAMAAIDDIPAMLRRALVGPAPAAPHNP